MDEHKMVIKINDEQAMDRKTCHTCNTHVEPDLTYRVNEAWAGCWSCYKIIIDAVYKQVEAIKMTVSDPRKEMRRAYLATIRADPGALADSMNQVLTTTPAIAPPETHSPWLVVDLQHGTNILYVYNQQTGRNGTVRLTLEESRMPLPRWWPDHGRVELDAEPTPQTADDLPRKGWF